jgi:hypothetical protein
MQNPAFIRLHVMARTRVALDRPLNSFLRLATVAVPLCFVTGWIASSERDGMIRRELDEEARCDYSEQTLFSVLLVCGSLSRALHPDSLRNLVYSNCIEASSSYTRCNLLRAHLQNQTLMPAQVSEGTRGAKKRQSNLKHSTKIKLETFDQNKSDSSHPHPNCVGTAQRLMGTAQRLMST